jgi:PAS domain S-box-containing protein
MKDVNKTKEQLSTKVKSPRRQVSLPKRTETERTTKKTRKNAMTKSYQHQKETEALLEAARAIMRHQTFRDAAQSIFDICKNFTGATSGYVALLSKDGTENEVLFLDAGGLPCTVDQSLPMPIRGLRGEAYQTGKTVYDNDFSKSKWMRFMPQGHVALDNVMFAPLVIEGKTVGLLGLANKPGGFTEDDIRLASIMGDFISIGLVNSKTLEELEYSDQRFRSITESIPDGMVTIDAHGDIVFWNHAMEKMFGYTAEEMLGKPITIIMPERFHENHKSSLNRVTSGGKPRIIGKTVAIIGLRKDASEFPLELSLAKWNTGEGIFFTAVVRDISERKQIEKTLKESEDKFRSLVESTSDWIWEIDSNGIYTYASPKVKDLLGYEPEEIIGKTPFDLMPVEEAKRIANIFRDIVAASKPIERLENTCRHKNGYLMILETSGVPILDSRGKLCGYRGVDRDITERKQAEQELNFRAQLIDAAIDSIFVHDFDGNIIYANEVAYKSLGYTKDELMRMNIRELAVPEYAAIIEPKLPDFLKAGKAVFEFAHLRKDKSIKPVEIHSQIIESGNRQLVLGIARDITERKKMQDSLIITDRLAALGNMAGGFAHELNNPLTSVIGYSQLLLDRKDLPQDVRSDLTGIYEEAQRASEVIKNFMVFALKRPQQKQPSDINDLIKDVLKLRKHAHRKNNITVKTNFDPELPPVTVGPVRMRQVFLNIVTNAEYFMFDANEKGILTITTEKTVDIVRASFSDDGPGISPENLGQIFNPFFTTKEIGQGIGLGLSTCHSIVTEHGGKIYVESEPGKGATFIVELPINNK